MKKLALRPLHSSISKARIQETHKGVGGKGNSLRFQLRKKITYHRTSEKFR